MTTWTGQLGQDNCDRVARSVQPEKNQDFESFNS
jgi:hypothetical protein